MKWINVKDKLPEFDKNKSLSSENVLIFCSEGIFVACIALSRKKDEYYWSEQSTGCGCCSSTLSPTHWMPLPEKPV